MRYLILCYGDTAAEGALGAEERRAIVARHVEFGRRLSERGALVLGEALAADAKVLRLDGEAQPLVTDGPFAETKEQLGGFYVLDCADLDEAVAWAQQVPRSPGLVVEVRPTAG